MRPIRPSIAALVSVMAFVLNACVPSAPRAVIVGEDECGYCRMVVTDARFAAQVVTNTGRVHVFDSIDCLAGFVRGTAEGGLRGAWVSDVENPGELIPVEEAGYLQASTIRGPMGSTVAFATPAAAHAARSRLGGTVVDWAAIRADSSARGH